MSFVNPVSFSYRSPEFHLESSASLLQALRQGDFNTIRSLVQHTRMDVNQPLENGATPLFVAAQEGHLGIVRFLVKEGKANVNQPMAADGATPLYIAAEGNHLG